MARIELKREPDKLSVTIICDSCGKHSGLAIKLEDSITKLAAGYVMGILPKLLDGSVGQVIPGSYLCEFCEENITEDFLARNIERLKQADQALQKVQRSMTNDE